MVKKCTPEFSEQTPVTEGHIVNMGDFEKPPVVPLPRDLPVGHIALNAVHIEAAQLEEPPSQ